MSRAAPIRALPEDIQAQIKSSAVLNSINDVAIGLLKNALDAESSKVSITVDYVRGNCEVEDDGVGIPSTAFEEGGSLGRMHHTSKFPGDGQMYGQYGQFLASVSALSILTITSRQINASAQPLTSFHRSRVIIRREHNLDPQMLIPHARGTIASVKSLFGDLPVRVKQRAMRYESNSAEISDLEDLKKRVVGCLLPWPQKCKAVLRERGKGVKCIFNSQHLGEHVSIEGPNKDRTFHLPSICTLMRQAGYIQHFEAASWKVVSARSPDASIRAAISLVPSPNKRVQFASIGINLLDTYQNAIVYDEVNKLFSLSDFGTVRKSYDGDGDDEEPFQRSKHVSSKGTGQSCKQVKGLPKGVDKWPMFFIRIDPKVQSSSQQVQEACDMRLEPSQNPQAIIDLLRSLILQFLEQHHFRPKKPRRRQTKRPATDEEQRHHSTMVSETKGYFLNSSGETLSHLRSTAEIIRNDSADISVSRIHRDTYRNWSRIKSSDSAFVKDLLSGLPGSNIPHLTPSTNNGALQLYQRNLESNFRISSREPDPDDIIKTRNSSENAHDDSAQMPESPDANGIRLWTSPLSRQKVYINARTGQVVPEASIARVKDNNKDEDSRRLNDLKPASFNQADLFGVPKDSDRHFIRDAFQDWDNPVFGNTELPISKVNLDRRFTEFDNTGFNYLSGASKTASTPVQFCGQSLEVLGAKLRRSDLGNATVLGQVDHKFIVLKLEFSPCSGVGDGFQVPILAILDQHAADERCKIEQLLGDMFYLPEAGNCSTAEIGSVKVSQLPKPITFEASARETQLFQQRKSYFLTWGFDYETISPETSFTATGPQTPTIVITKVPSVIAERLRLHPELLIDILRLEIWSEHQRHSSSGAAIRQSSPTMAGSQPADTWTMRLQTCPRGLIDMLNSRACRSAIMFSDALSVEECRALVRRLASCRFPFVCAHGRPSMAVLGTISSGRIRQDWERDENEHGKNRFVKKCKEWMEQ